MRTAKFTYPLGEVEFDVEGDDILACFVRGERVQSNEMLYWISLLGENEIFARAKEGHRRDPAKKGRGVKLNSNDRITIEKCLAVELADCSRRAREAGKPVEQQYWANKARKYEEALTNFRIACALDEAEET